MTWLGSCVTPFAPDSSRPRDRRPRRGAWPRWLGCGRLGSSQANRRPSATTRRAAGRLPPASRLGPATKSALDHTSAHAGSRLTTVTARSPSSAGSPVRGSMRWWIRWPAGPRYRPSRIDDAYTPPRRRAPACDRPCHTKWSQPPPARSFSRAITRCPLGSRTPACSAHGTAEFGWLPPGFRACSRWSARSASVDDRNRPGSWAGAGLRETRGTDRARPRARSYPSQHRQHKRGWEGTSR
jgi:hypothetical protein